MSRKHFYKRLVENLTIVHQSLLAYLTVLNYILVFYPRPVLAFGYCRCLLLFVCVCVSVCVWVNHLLVRAITRDPYKLGSPNLDQRCKTPLLRTLWVWWTDRPWLSRSNLTWKFKFTPFWACPHHNSPPIQARITKFGPEMQNILVKIPIVFLFFYYLFIYFFWKGGDGRDVINLGIQGHIWK